MEILIDQIGKTVNGVAYEDEITAADAAGEKFSGMLNDGGGYQVGHVDIEALQLPLRIDLYRTATRVTYLKLSRYCGAVLARVDDAADLVEAVRTLSLAEIERIRGEIEGVAQTAANAYAVAERCDNVRALVINKAGGKAGDMPEIHVVSPGATKH